LTAASVAIEKIELSRGRSRTGLVRFQSPRLKVAGVPDYSEYQKKIIKRFYENRDDIDSTRLAEIAGELYLAAAKKKDRLWKQASEIMTRLSVPPTRIAHVLKTSDPAMLAEVVNDLQKGLIVPAPKPKPTPPA
jgi:hypothetical protein